MKSIKYFRVATLACALLYLSMSTSASAPVTIVQPSSETYTAKVAYITNVDQYGHQIVTDEYDSNQNTIGDIQLGICNTANELVISGCLNGTDIEVSGTPVAYSENSAVIYYEASCSSDEFLVVNLTYETNITDSAYYFKSYNTTHNNADSILKLYLRPLNSSTRDYYIVEVLGFSMPNKNTLLNAIPSDAPPYSWIANEFEPDITNLIEEPATYSARTLVPYDTKTFVLSKTYTHQGYTETHTLTYELYRNVPITIRTNGQVDLQYQLKIDGKTITSPDAPNYNSSDSSHISISGIKLTQTTISNTAFMENEVFGNFRNYTGYSYEASISIGFNFYFLSASVSMPVTFTDSSTVSSNNGKITYTNPDENGKYVRSVVVESPEDTYLSRVGDVFTVKTEIQDYCGVIRGTSTFCAQWELEFRYMPSTQYYTATCSQDAPMSITD
ncbi:MAG: hypothetical protein ACI3ZG_03930 [Candidatus Coprenecus sp.]